MFFIDSHKFLKFNVTHSQWRSEAKCRPGPTIKVQPLQPRICFQHLKIKENQFFCLVKM